MPVGGDPITSQTDLLTSVAQQGNIPNVNVTEYLKGAGGNHTEALRRLLRDNGLQYSPQQEEAAHKAFGLKVFSPEYIQNNKLSDEERSKLQQEYTSIANSLNKGKSREINTGNWGGGFHGSTMSDAEKMAQTKKLNELDDRIAKDYELSTLMPNVKKITPSSIGPRSLSSIKNELQSLNDESERLKETGYKPATEPSYVFGGAGAGSAMTGFDLSLMQDRAAEVEKKKAEIKQKMDSEYTEEPAVLSAQTAFLSSKAFNGGDRKESYVNARYLMNDRAAKLKRQMDMAIDDYKSTGSEEDKAKIDNIFSHIAEQSRQIATGYSLADGVEKYAQAAVKKIDAEAQSIDRAMPALKAQNPIFGLLGGDEVSFVKSAAKQFVLGWKNSAWSLDDMLNGKGQSYEKFLANEKSRGMAEADATMPAAYRGTPIDAYVDVDGQKFLVDGNGDIQGAVDKDFKDLRIDVNNEDDIQKKADAYEKNRGQYEVHSGLTGGHINVKKMIGANTSVALNMIPIIATSAAIASVPGGEMPAVQYLGGIASSGLMMFHQNFEDQLKVGKGFNYAWNTAGMITLAQSLVEQGFGVETGMGTAVAKSLKAKGLKQELDGFIRAGMEAPTFIRKAYDAYGKYIVSGVQENIEEEVQSRQDAAFNWTRNGIDKQLDPLRVGNTALSMLFSVGGLEALSHIKGETDGDRWKNGYIRALIEPEGTTQVIDALEKEGALTAREATIKKGILSGSKKMFDGILADTRLSTKNKQELLKMMAERDRWRMASDNIEIGPGKEKYMAKADEIDNKITEKWDLYNSQGEAVDRNNPHDNHELNDITDEDAAKSESAQPGEASADGAKQPGTATDAGTDSGKSTNPSTDQAGTSAETVPKTVPSTDNVPVLEKTDAVGKDVIPYSPAPHRITFYDTIGDNTVVENDKGQEGVVKVTEGGVVSVEYNNNQTHELGNLDDLSDKTLDEFGLKVKNVESMNSRTYKVGNDIYVSDDINNAIKRDQDGNVVSVTLSKVEGGKVAKTEEFTGQQADNLAYQIVLDQFSKIQSDEGIRAIEEAIPTEKGSNVKNDNNGQKEDDGKSNETVTIGKTTYTKRGDRWVDSKGITASKEKVAEINQHLLPPAEVQYKGEKHVRVNGIWYNDVTDQKVSSDLKIKKLEKALNNEKTDTNTSSETPKVEDVVQPGAKENAASVPQGEKAKQPINQDEINAIESRLAQPDNAKSSTTIESQAEAAERQAEVVSQQEEKNPEEVDAQVKDIDDAIDKIEEQLKEIPPVIIKHEESKLSLSGLTAEQQDAAEAKRVKETALSPKEKNLQNLVEAINDYEALAEGARGKATAKGNTIFNKALEAAAALGYTIKRFKSRDKTYVSVFNKDGSRINSLANNFKEQNYKSITPNRDRGLISNRSQEVIDLFKKLWLEGASSSMPIVYGVTLSNAQKKIVFQDVADGIPSNGAEALLNQIEKSIKDGFIVFHDKHLGDMAVNVDDFLNDKEAEPKPVPKAEEKPATQNNNEEAPFQIKEDPNVKKARILYEAAQKRLNDVESRIAKDQAEQTDMFGGNKPQGKLFIDTKAEIKRVLNDLRKQVKDAKDALDRAKVRAEEEANKAQGQQSLFQAIKKLFVGEKMSPIGIKTFNQLIDNLNKSVGNVFGGVLTGKEYAQAVKDKAGRDISTIKGIVYGFVGNDGKVYINGDRINANTPVHEYGHVWISFTKNSAPDVYQRGLKLADKSSYLIKLLGQGKTSAYADLIKKYNEGDKAPLLEEALAWAIGDEGEKLVKSVKGEFVQWLHDLWENIKSVFGGALTDFPVKELQNLTFKQFTSIVARQLVSGTPITSNALEESVILRKVNNYAREIVAGRSTLKRLPPGAEQGRIEGGIHNVAASIISGRSRETDTGAREDSAENAGRRVKEQSQRLEVYAKSQGIWVEPEDLVDKFGKIFKGGSESTIHLNGDGYVTKVNNLSFYGQEDGNLLDFFDRIAIHNHLFPTTKYTLVGFTNDLGGLMAIVRQPFIANAVPTHFNDTTPYMHKLGFKGAYGTYYNDNYIVRDLHQDNILTGEDGLLYVIDPAIRLNNQARFGGKMVAGDIDIPDEPIAQEDAKLQKGEFNINVNGTPATVKPLPYGVDVVNGFYSPLEKTLAETKVDKLSVKQWIDKFGKGEEAKWTGLTDWLAQQQGSVSKADIQQYLKDNRIQVVEVVNSGKSEKYYQLVEEQKNASRELDILESDLDNWSDENYKESRDKKYELNDKIKELSNQIKEEESKTKDTKFENYQLEGEKENYKEVLVTMPAPETGAIPDLPKDWGAYLRKGVYEVENASGEVVAKDADIDKAIAKAQPFVPQRKKTNRGEFKSSHFDEPNILVHLRMNTRVDAEGKKVLFLEEVQSDWGQQGKKSGFANTEQISKLRDEETKLRDSVKKNKGEITADTPDDVYNKIRNENKLLEEQIYAIQTKITDLQSKSTPSAPFVTDTNAWTKLGLKVALKEAVKQGADKIAWTTGEQQNDRYDLSKQVDWINAEKTNKGDYKIEVGHKDNRPMETQYLKENELEANLGKELATKIINDGGGMYRGLDLKVGGKGMKGFYGSPAEGSLGIVGNVAKSLFKQEPKITEIQIKEGDISKGRFIHPTITDAGYGMVRDSRNNNEEIYSPNNNITDVKKWIENKMSNKENRGDLFSIQHSIGITPELRAEVSQGLPQFQVKDEIDAREDKTRKQVNKERVDNAMSKVRDAFNEMKILGAINDPRVNAARQAKLIDALFRLAVAKGIQLKDDIVAMIKEQYKNVSNYQAHAMARTIQAYVEAYNKPDLDKNITRDLVENGLDIDSAITFLDNRYKNDTANRPAILKYINDLKAKKAYYESFTEPIEAKSRKEFLDKLGALLAQYKNIATEFREADITGHYEGIDPNILVPDINGSVIHAAQFIQAQHDAYVNEYGGRTKDFIMAIADYLNGPAGKDSIYAETITNGVIYFIAELQASGSKYTTTKYYEDLRAELVKGLADKRSAFGRALAMGTKEKDPIFKERLSKIEEFKNNLDEDIDDEDLDEDTHQETADFVNYVKGEEEQDRKHRKMDSSVSKAAGKNLKTMGAEVVSAVREAVKKCK